MIIYKQKERTHFDDILFHIFDNTDFGCDAKLMWLCECAWLEIDVVALAAQRSWGGAGWPMPLKLPFPWLQKCTPSPIGFRLMTVHSPKSRLSYDLSAYTHPCLCNIDPRTYNNDRKLRFARLCTAFSVYFERVSLLHMPIHYPRACAL